MVSYLLNIFELKWTICNVYSIIPEAWNIQTCKCLTSYRYSGIHVATQRWRRRIVSSLPEYSPVLHNVYITGKLTQCVTCKVYWNTNGWTCVHRVHKKFHLNCIRLKRRGDWFDTGQIQKFATQWLKGHFGVQICQDVRLILKRKIHTGNQRC